MAEGWVPRAPGSGRVSLRQMSPRGWEITLSQHQQEGAAAGIFPLGSPLFLEKESQAMAGPAVAGLWINNRILRMKTQQQDAGR